MSGWKPIRMLKFHRLMVSAVLVGTGALAAVANPVAQARAAPEWPSGPPESQGFDSRLLSALV